MIDEILNSIPHEDEVREKELADIIVWALAQDEVSALKIKGQFTMGNRANDIIDNLVEMGIVSGKHANLPRSVLVNTITELSEDVVNFVTRHGYTTEQLSEIFSRKFKSMSADKQSIEADTLDMPEYHESFEEDGELE